LLFYTFLYPLIVDKRGILGSDIVVLEIILKITHSVQFLSTDAIFDSK